MNPNHYHILWADDDADDLFIVREVMESYDGYHVVEMSNGRQVLDYLNTIKSSALLPTLIILDINMPVLNGKETLAMIKGDERYTHLAVAVFTTSNNEKDRQFCERFGAKMYTKPHSFGGFKKIISDLLMLRKHERSSLTQ